MAEKFEWRRVKNKKRQDEIDEILERQATEYKRRLIDAKRKAKADRIGGKHDSD